AGQEGDGRAVALVEVGEPQALPVAELRGPGKVGEVHARDGTCARSGVASRVMSTTAPAKVDLDRLSIDTIRTLSMDAVQKANSGHPGMPMAMAPAAYLLYTRFMRHNPKDPSWPDRDRFVLSAGHGSMLLYSVLHLSGY